MTWNTTPFEEHMHARLEHEFGNATATSMFASFVTTRDKVLNEIRQIAGVEPDLSDHGKDHIENVLANVLSLTSNDPAVHGMSALDLYVQGLAVLFHDVGNLFGRADHHKRVAEVFDWARGTDAKTRREKTLVLKAVEAHTGTTSSGSRNTLAEVDIADHLNGKQIQLRQIAATLRFADELAEGPQRTTDFFRKFVGYSPSSHLFHLYASCTHVAADRAHERVQLTYELQLEEISPTGSERHKPLTEFLTFVFQRIGKLDDERRYGRFYSPLLQAFKQTDVVLNFSEGSQLLPFDVRFSLDDLVVPGAAGEPFESRLKDKCDGPSELASRVLTLITDTEE